MGSKRKAAGAAAGPAAQGGMLKKRALGENGAVQRDLSQGTGTISLLDLLRDCGPTKQSRFGSQELFPTEFIKPVIQAVVKAGLQLIKSKRKHGFLCHPENWIVHREDCSLYSDDLLDLGNYHSIDEAIRKAKIRESPSAIRVSIINSKSDDYMDDIKGLERLIFDVILADPTNSPLPEEWKQFQELFSKSKPMFPLIGSHPCMWPFEKKLRYFTTVHHWYFYTNHTIQRLVYHTLSRMAIVHCDFWTYMDKDEHLKNISQKTTNEYKQGPVELLRLFRNVIEHQHQKCHIPSCPCSKTDEHLQRDLLEYKFNSLCYPRLLGELYAALLRKGFWFY